MEQDISAKEKEDIRINGNNSKNNLNFEDRQTLTSAFAWLIEEDKKQNPSLYRIKKTAI